MRSLRKIIFVNSANIRYAEVKLDGNVHFIGTQGVGKSTLLRAILFFYNADKLHLGIPKEMRSFDDFYLPHANSYIVYEVEHEHCPFSIIVFRSSGRACYRFINDAFHKEWLIDEHGEVTAESKVIRARLNGKFMSRTIDRYEHYRDIIYGNKHTFGKEFAQFRLLETNQYQNIPRSIQNVFLNSRLDADFIKEIIIRSMSEEEAYIDLGYFRRQVAGFEQEYKDISCWYKLNQKGESTVRTQADNVVNIYNRLLSMKQQIENLCGELKYAERTSREKLPLIDESIEELNREQERQKRLQAELYDKFNKEKDCLNNDLGAVKNNLNRLKECRDYYVKNNIDEVIERCQKEPGLKAHLEGLKDQLNELTSRFTDITTKYQKLRTNITNRLDAFSQAQKECILDAKEKKQNTDERLLAELTSANKSIEAMFADKIANANAKIDAIKAEQHDCEKELFGLKFLKPFQKEKNNLEQQINSLNLQEKDLEGKIATLKAEIERIQTDYDNKESKITDDYNHKIAERKAIAEAITEKIEAINAKLSSINGSFYEWLQDNKSDWEQNIGKIIDEDNVLYKAGLQPQITEGNSLFGVEIDLTSIPLNVRKPKQLKEEKTALEKQLNDEKSEQTKLHNTFTQKIEELKCLFTPKIKELRKQKTQYETELDIIPQQLKTIKVKIGDYDAQALQVIDNSKIEITERRKELANKLIEAQSEYETIITDKQKQQKLAEKKYNDAKEENLKNYTVIENKINDEIEEKKREADVEVKELEHQEMQELKGHDVDTTIIKECKAKINATENELKYINDNRTLLICYNKDKTELFDKEDEFKNNIRFITEKLAQLKEKYEQRNTKYQQQLAIIAKELNEQKNNKKNIDEELNKASNFINDTNLCPSYFYDAKEKESLLTPAMAVDKLTSIIVNRQNCREKFKQSINLFKGNFTAKNTFNFKTELNSEEDYLDFADNLNDFLINNKIEEYRTRTSERYVEILARVSKEMGELTRHESDVDRIIHDINNDFIERNFVGVIKLIALQSVQSADKMVQLMKRIKAFNDDNSLSLGELNIFSAVDRNDINRKAVDNLLDFMKSLNDNPSRQYLTLSDLFQLQFRIKENDNDTGWADKLSHVGSEGTDTLVKAMINIMLINVFKEKVSRKFGDFRIHCMMDEIGKLHPQNIKGILDFANARNILLINSSPTTYNVSNYRYTYLLQKDGKSKTVIHPLISQK